MNKRIRHLSNIIFIIKLFPQKSLIYIKHNYILDYCNKNRFNFLANEKSINFLLNIIK
jgi:hypothetical protein